MNEFEFSGRRGLCTKSCWKKRKVKGSCYYKCYQGSIWHIAYSETTSVSTEEGNDQSQGPVCAFSKCWFVVEWQTVFYLLSIVTLATTTTTKKRGYPTSDDMRVHTVVLAIMLPTLGSTKQHSTREIAKVLGLSDTTYWCAKKAVAVKRATLEGIHSTLDKASVMFSQVVKRKQWIIMCPHDVKAK